MRNVIELGLIVVWSAGQCRADELRVPADGLLLGRGLLEPADERMSQRHARIDRVEGRLVLEDVGSRGGTWVNGESRLTKIPVSHHTVIRTGRTIWCVAELGDRIAIRFVEEIHAEIRRLDPDVKIHATAIEACLVMSLRKGSSATAIGLVNNAIRNRAQADLRGTDFVEPPDLVAAPLYAAQGLDLHKGVVDELADALRAASIDISVHKRSVDARSGGTRSVSIRCAWRDARPEDVVDRRKPYNGRRLTVELRDGADKLATAELTDLAAALAAVRSWLAGHALAELPDFRALS